ncbi:MAG: hypothetical protein ACHQZR_00025 [Candidatus Limnocylindrales bacterium]
MNVSDKAQEILVTSARALAQADGLVPTLRALLDAIAEPLGIASAAIVVADARSGHLRIAASFGLGQDAEAGLAAAIGNPGHPIARTVANPVATFDVQPTAPGGPALRSHLPLTVTHDGRQRVLGVLALAHERPVEQGVRPLLQAGADLAAVAVERYG